MKIILHLTLISLFTLNFSYAGCGKCKTHKKKVETTQTVEVISTVGENGSISGLVQTSCGMCNFGMKNQKGCSLAIQVANSPIQSLEQQYLTMVINMQKMECVMQSE